MFVNKFLKIVCRKHHQLAIGKLVITRAKNNNNVCCKVKIAVAAVFQGKVKASVDVKAARQYH